MGHLKTLAAVAVAVALLAGCRNGAAEAGPVSTTTSRPVAGDLCGLADEWSPKLTEAALGSADLRSAERLLGVWADFLTAARPHLAGGGELGDRIRSVRGDLSGAGYDPSQLTNDERRRLLELVADEGGDFARIQAALTECARKSAA